MNVNYVFSWTRVTYGYMVAASLPGVINVEFSGPSIPAVNGIRIWPYASPASSPTAFTLAGGESVSTAVWTTIVNPSEQEYTSLTWKEWSNPLASTKYPALRLTITAGSTTYTNLFEVQFLVCNAAAATSIPYPTTDFQYYAHYSVVDIVPSIFGVTDCQSTTPLPTGLSVNPTTCAITGTASVAAPQTTYTISAQLNGETITGTVTMTFTECEGTMLRILRTYRSNASTEGFRIRNTANDDILLVVMTGHTNPDKHRYCQLSVCDC